jgi:hypothetical protein
VDTLSFFSELVSSLAWPIAAVVIAFLFKGEITKLLGRITHVKYGDSEIEFREGVKKTSQQAKETLPEDSSENEARSNRLYELAKVSPRGAIIDAWLGVEEKLREYATRSAIEQHSSTIDLIRAVDWHSMELGTIGKGVIRMLYKLQSLRDEAVHLTDSSIDTSTAIDYVNLAERVQNRLEEA